jgi:hypothetical protein
MVKRELASLDVEIDEMTAASRLAWDQGNMMAWLTASRLALAWWLRRELIQIGVPLPIRFEDES